MKIDIGLIGALVLIGLAVLGIARIRPRHRGRRGRRGHHGRSLSKLMVHKLPFGKAEKPAEKRERLLREFNAYKKANPGATRMPLSDDAHPEPSWVTRKRRQLWARAVTEVRKRRSPF